MAWSLRRTITNSMVEIRFPMMMAFASQTSTLCHGRNQTTLAADVEFPYKGSSHRKSDYTLTANM
jgi:hypothetical protein